MKKVLVIDGDMFNRLLMKEFLRLHNIEVIACKLGEEAKTVFNSDFSAVFLNTRLDDITGIEVLKWIKNQYPEIPVFGISAENPSGEFDMKTEIMFDSYYELPLNMNKLSIDIPLFLN